MSRDFKVDENIIESDIDVQQMEKIIIEQSASQISKRIVIRPKINIFKDAATLIISILIPLVILLLIFHFFSFNKVFFALLCICTALIWIALNAKKLLITLIILYQKYAPESIRSACLFEPCCSEYMKLSIMKYGVIKGLFKGIKRILRCRYPNGGIDEP